MVDMVKHQIFPICMFSISTFQIEDIILSSHSNYLTMSNIIPQIQYRPRESIPLFPCTPKLPFARTLSTEKPGNNTSISRSFTKGRVPRRSTCVCGHICSRNKLHIFAYGGYLNAVGTVASSIQLVKIVKLNSSKLS